MKKENKQLAQERRAAERARQERNEKLKIGLSFAAVILIIVGIIAAVVMNPMEDSGKGSATGDKNNGSGNKVDEDVITKPVIELDKSKTYYATIEIEEYGTIKVQLDQETAPVTVSNFVKLAQDKFYDGLTFHRIIEGFMMQGGDPNGNGSGGSKQNIVGEFSKNGHDNPIKHERGVISMARSNSYNSASSQFFIMHEDAASLDGLYAAFGHVVEGMDVVDAICESAEPTGNNGMIPKEEQPKIKSVTITTEDN